MKRMRASLIVLVALAVVVTTLTGCGRGTVAKVNGEKIRKEEFYSRLQRVQVPTQQGVRLAGEMVMRQMIDEKLMKQLAKEQGVEPTEAQIKKRVDLIKKQSGGRLSTILAQQNVTMQEFEKQQAATQAMVNVVTKGITVPDSEVKGMYSKMLQSPNGGLKRPEQVSVSVIITKDKAKIDKAAELLKSAEFGTVAAKMSDPEVFTKQSNGKIGWASRDGQIEMVTGRKAEFGKEFANKVFAMKTGAISEPMKYGQQWVIFRADQRRKAKTTPYEDVKDMIREQLALQKGSVKGDAARAMQKFAKDADIVLSSQTYKPIGEQIKKDAANALKAGAQPTPTTDAKTTKPAP